MQKRNTRWAFTQKHDIFTYENNMLSSREISLLLWLHNRSHLSQQKSEMVWYFIGVYVIKNTLHGCLEIPSQANNVWSCTTNK